VIDPCFGALYWTLSRGFFFEKQVKAGGSVDPRFDYSNSADAGRDQVLRNGDCVSGEQETRSVRAKGSHMTADYSEGHPHDGRGSGAMTSGDITIQIAERDGHQVIVIKEQQAEEAEPAAQQVIEIPAILLPELKQAIAALEENSGGDQARVNQLPASFAHDSEAEFARILDFYHIAWQYEPRSFPVEWDEGRNVTSSFTPDFYLPQHDLYIELTTLKQSLVTKKNRKVRRLRELYPEVNIKILYASDYRKLVEKFAGSGAWQEDGQDDGAEEIERENGEQ